MRQHLGKALKTWSAAIKTAVDRFNKAARSLGKDILEYDAVVEKTYLSELDFLRETRDDVRAKKWAQPANRTLVTKYCKIWGAHYELDRLHVEIKRLVTYMKEERTFCRRLKRTSKAVILPSPIKLLCIVGKGGVSKPGITLNSVESTSCLASTQATCIISPLGRD